MVANMKEKYYGHEEYVSLLHKNYQDQDISGLVKISGRNPWAIKVELLKQAQNNPEGWDTSRVSELREELHRNHNTSKYTELQQFRRGNIKEDIIFRSYESKGIYELSELTDRKPDLIIRQLMGLSKYKPKKYDSKRIKTIIRDYKRGIGVKERPVWSEEQLEILHSNYKIKDFYELSKLTSHSIGGIAQKLGKLVVRKPKGWDIKRIKVLRNQLYKDYNPSPEQREKLRQYGRRYYNRKKEQSLLIYKKFIEREKNWSDLDTCILTSTYITKSYFELAEIFSLKEIGVIQKLRFLHEQEPNAWDKERISELELETAKIIKPLITNGSRYDRDKKIDDLIEQGFNQPQIGAKLGKERQEINNYIIFRDLSPWYKEVQKTKKETPQNLVNILFKILLTRSKSEDIPLYHALMNSRHSRIDFEQRYKSYQAHQKKMSFEKAAKYAGVSVNTIQRNWKKAGLKAWYKWDGPKKINLNIITPS